ncbi:hypothetical protein K8R03_03875 [Candidatus Kaiserbacteria bacterium]|nr:hypothetical protein [Candidatus Kaiserbacteria bacterium]
MTKNASIALFGTGQLRGTFDRLMSSINRNEDCFVSPMPSPMEISDGELTRLLSERLRPVNFAVVGLAGPYLEMRHSAQLLSQLTVPCAAFVNDEGYKALVQTPGVIRSNIRVTVLLQPGTWEGGLDRALEYFEPRSLISVRGNELSHCEIEDSARAIRAAALQ